MSTRSSAPPSTMTLQTGAGSLVAVTGAGASNRLSTTTLAVSPLPTSVSAVAPVPAIGNSANAAAGGSSSPAGSSSPVQSPEHRARSSTPTESASVIGSQQPNGASGTATPNAMAMTSSTASSSTCAALPVPATSHAVALHPNELSFSNLPLVGCPPMLVRRSRCALCAAGGRLYAAGGFNGESNLCSVEMFDPLVFYKSLLEQNLSSNAAAAAASSASSQQSYASGVSNSGGGLGILAASANTEMSAASLLNSTISSGTSIAGSSATVSGSRSSPMLSGAPASPSGGGLNGWQFVAQLVAHEGGVALGVLPLLLD